MKPSERTIIVLFVGFIILLGAIAIRLFDLQVIKHARYVKMAADQQVFLSSIPAKRGTIYDRDLRPLAVTLPAYQVFADPEMVTDPKRLAVELAGFALGDVKTLYSKLTKDSRFVWINRSLDVEATLKLQARLKELNLAGLYFQPSGKRTRPLEELADNVLGHVSIDDEPLGGVEQTLDGELRGKPGLRRYFRDALGKQRPCVEAIVNTPVSGNSAVLTIDAELQEIAESELDLAVEEHKATGGCVVIVDPRSGDILALASNPRHLDFPVTSVFEPGSSFKLCTISAGLDLGKVDTLTVMDTYGGCLPVAGGKPIKDDHPGGVMDLREAVRRSSNVYAALVARRIGRRDFFRYMHTFGFGLKTGIGLEGESKGLLKDPGQWSGRSLETMGMGQEIGVTAIQLAMAYAAVANGGTLYRPRLIKAVIDESGDVKKSFPPKVVRTVIRKETARVMAGLLERVVNCGTGTAAGIKGIDIAGKTGTGQKAVNGAYLKGSYCAIFGGYLPADEPSFVCVVVVDEPMANGYYGGVVSAPVFKNIMEYALKRDKILLPAQCYNLAARADKKKPAAVVAAASACGKDEVVKKPKGGVYPQVLGLTLKEAAEALGKAEIKWRAFGSGIVLEQKPEGEAPLDDTKICNLFLGETE